MIMKGQKRKLPAEDPDGGCPPTWESQRQFVFSVSLSKYQRGQELPEPSLRRSVLIANTLRQINLEAYGGPPRGPWSPEQDAASAPSTGPGSTQPSPSHVSTGVEDEDWGSMSAESDFSLSAAISSILTALESTVDGGPQAAHRAPLRSLENLPASSYGGVKQGGDWEQHESSVEVMRSSYLSDLTMEDLFQDIDTSLLERELGRGSGDGCPAGEDPLCYPPIGQKCLPSFASFGSPTLFSGQGLELDPLMEILVES